MDKLILVIRINQYYLSYFITYKNNKINNNKINIDKNPKIIFILKNV